MELSKYPVPHPQVAARVVDGSAVIVLADSGEVQVLNSVGTRIWELMDGTRSVRDIESAIESEYEVSLGEAARDVQELVQQLLAAQAIVLRDDASTST
jgi:hypothetical protein